MWLLRQETLRELRAAQQTLTAISAEQQSSFAADVEKRAEAARDNGPRSLNIAGNVAQIRVEGILVPRMSFLLWLLGYAQTTWTDLQAAIAEARTQEEVTDVQLLVSSPGGALEGMFDTLAALERLREEKTVRVRAWDAFSAAYGIAAVAGPIEAVNPAAGFGSVGVVVSYLIEEDVVDITNSESPDKRPNLETKEGQKSVVAYLDALFELFAESIAKGRGTTVEDVTKNFGRGASLVARDAIKRGMIDSIATPPLRVVKSGSAEADSRPTASARGGEQQENSMDEMDLRTLRADHPELYEQAVAEGARQERDRVCAHLELGEQSGAMDIALEAVRGGTEMTQTLTAKYLAAGMNRSAQQTRQEETDQAGAAADGAKPNEPSAEESLGAKVVAELERRRGKDKPSGQGEE